MSQHGGHTCEARGWVGALVDERLEHVDVMRGNPLGYGEVARDAPRHPELIDVDQGVAGDDRASREVDTLAHEVATDAAVLALEPLAERLDWPAGAVHVGSGNPGLAVVHERDDCMLQQLHVLLQSSRQM